MDFVRQVSEGVVVPRLTAGHHEPRRRRRRQAGRILAVALIAVAIVGVVALAVTYGPRSSPTGPSAASTTQRAVLVPTSPTSHGMLQQAASIMKARLQALGDNDVGVTVTAGSIEVSGPVSEADVRLVGMRGTFYIRPVLCGAPPYSATPPGGAGPTATTTTPSCAAVYQTTTTNLGVTPNANAPNGFTENTVLPGPGVRLLPVHTVARRQSLKDGLATWRSDFRCPAVRTIRAGPGRAKWFGDRFRPRAGPSRSGFLDHRHPVDALRLRAVGRSRLPEFSRADRNRCRRAGALRSVAPTDTSGVLVLPGTDPDRRQLHVNAGKRSCRSSRKWAIAGRSSAAILVDMDNHGVIARAKLLVPVLLLVAAAASGCGGSQTGTVQGRVIFKVGTTNRYGSSSTLQLISARPGSHGAVLATEKASPTGRYHFTVDPGT